MSACRHIFICIIYTYIPICTHEYIGVYIQYVYMYNIHTHIQHTSIYTKYLCTHKCVYIRYVYTRIHTITHIQM